MGKLTEALKEYLENVSPEQLQKDWEELKIYNDKGIDVTEFLESIDLKESKP